MNITDDIWAWARKSPDAPAILTARGTLSFAELDRAVSAGVRAFSEAGLKPGDRAGIHSQNQIQYLITFLALARMGVALFAFRFNDAARNRQQLARGLKISVIVTDAQSKWDAAAFSFVPPPPGRLAQLKEFSVADCPGAEDGDLPFLFVATSGSTGTPKLGVFSHKQYRPRLIPSAHEPAGPGTRLLSIINLTFLAPPSLRSAAWPQADAYAFTLAARSRDWCGLLPARTSIICSARRPTQVCFWISPKRAKSCSQN